MSRHELLSGGDNTETMEQNSGQGISRRGFVKAAAVAGATVAGGGVLGMLTACGNNTAPAPSGETAGERLSNQTDLETAAGDLKTAYNAVAGFDANIVGGATATDEQAQAIRDFGAVLTEARALADQTEAYIAAAQEAARDNGETPPAYDTTALEELRSALEQAEAFNPLAQYNTRLWGDDGTWLADRAASDPKFAAELTSAPDLSGGNYVEYWNWQKKQVEYQLANPSDATDAYSSERKPKSIGEYVSASESLNPLEAQGFVIEFGKQEIEGAGAPEVSSYVYPKEDVEPSAFAEGTKVYWNPFTTRKECINPNWFYTLYPESRTRQGQYWGVNYGTQELNTQAIDKGVNLRDAYIERGNATLDEVVNPANFSTTANYDNYGGAWSVGSILEFNKVDGGTVVTSFNYNYDGNWRTVRYPNPNDVNLHSIFDEAADSCIAPIYINGTTVTYR